MEIGPLDAPAFESFDGSFDQCVAPGVVHRLWSGGAWLEGPVWLRGSRSLVWSDIPNNRLLCWSEIDQKVTTFRQPSNGANGNTLDREGRLVTCEQYSRRISRTEFDGTVSVLADRFEGKRFNAPNDIVVKSDGSIWFTDPEYGSAPEYEGARELDGCHVYRLDPSVGVVTQMTSDMVMPNGLAFSLDETHLFVIDTGSTHLPGGPNHIRRFKVSHSGPLTGGEVIATSVMDTFDGLRLDTTGRLWCGETDGVHCFDPGGKLIGKLLLPERASNLTFGGVGNQQLFVTGSTSIYTCATGVHGAL